MRFTFRSTWWVSILRLVKFQEQMKLSQLWSSCINWPHLLHFETFVLFETRLNARGWFFSVMLVFLGCGNVQMTMATLTMTMTAKWFKKLNTLDKSKGICFFHSLLELFLFDMTSMRHDAKWHRDVCSDQDNSKRKFISSCRETKVTWDWTNGDTPPTSDKDTTMICNPALWWIFWDQGSDYQGSLLRQTHLDYHAHRRSALRVNQSSVTCDTITRNVSNSILYLFVQKTPHNWKSLGCV